MRFARRPDRHSAPSELPPTPGERLVRRTGAGLAVFTLALMAVLVAAIGLVTAAATVQITDQSVDSNLHTAAENMLTALAPTPSPTPIAAPTPTPTLASQPSDEVSTSQPEETDNGGDAGGESDAEGTGAKQTPSPSAVPSPTPAPSATPSPTPTPTPASTPTPVPTATPAPVAGGTTDERPPESSDTFFLVIDTAGHVTANPQHVQVTGLPDTDAIAGALGGREDWRTVSADGIRIRLLTEPMRGLDGAISGALQTGFVLTAQEEQQALIVRTIILASLIGLLGAALVTLFVTRRAMAPIRAAFDAERRFVASASHELKTPVSIVRASAEILQREDLVKPEGKYLVADVMSESDRLGRLVGDLLALASVQAGQVSISVSTFDARQLVDDVVDRVRGMAESRGVEVESVQESPSVSEPELLVSADRERMLQLLMIFIDNAIDHSPPRGVVHVVARAVDEGSRGGKRVVIEVLDQGPGVPLAERERIFEPFARVSGRRRTTGTTGLGLAIARILAARQNATLTVRDAPGGGACFSVSLARRASLNP